MDNIEMLGVGLWDLTSTLCHLIELNYRTASFVCVARVFSSLRCVVPHWEICFSELSVPVNHTLTYWPKKCWVWDCRDVFSTS